RDCSPNDPRWGCLRHQMLHRVWIAAAVEPLAAGLPLAGSSDCWLLVDLPERFPSMAARRERQCFVVHHFDFRSRGQRWRCRTYCCHSVVLRHLLRRDACSVRTICAASRPSLRVPVCATLIPLIAALAFPVIIASAAGSIVSGPLCYVASRLTIIFIAGPSVRVSAVVATLISWPILGVALITAAVAFVGPSVICALVVARLVAHAVRVHAVRFVVVVDGHRFVVGFQIGVVVEAVIVIIVVA